MSVELYTGDRNWRDYPFVIKCCDTRRQFVSKAVHGAARGADTLVGRWAKFRRIEVCPHPVRTADWRNLGLAAGVIRNQEMLDHHPDIGHCSAFHDDFAQSKGTYDMVRRCVEAGIPVTLFSHQGHWEIKNALDLSLLRERGFSA